MENFAINCDTLNFVQMNNSEDEIDQLVVLRKTLSYLDCDQRNSRFFCLNYYFRRRQVLKRFCA